MVRRGTEGVGGEEELAKKNLWIAAMMTIRGDEIHLKSEAFLALSKAEAYNIAYLNCHFEYSQEQGFNNHLASVGEVPNEKLRLILSGQNKLGSRTS